MENKVKRIGYLPRKRVLEIIDEISKSESISRSKVVGILVEEALDAEELLILDIAISVSPICTIQIIIKISKMKMPI